MSSPEPIKVELSAFEKLHILREELEERQKELAAIASLIRDKKQVMETQRYLESLSPYYASNPQEDLPTREELEALETKRSQLHELVENIEAMIPMMVDATSGKGQPAAQPAADQPPQQSAGPARKAKFDSFDDFLSSKP